jgi:hypothetical protein
VILWRVDAERRINLSFCVVGASCAATAMLGEGIERRRYVVSWVSAALAAFQFHSSSMSGSCRRLVRPDTMRSSTSVSQASRSASFSFADYAARRTMPNGLVSLRIGRDRHMIGSA